jgi:hypothetical protein
MSKQTAAVLKGSDPRPQLPLTIEWNVAALDLSTWTKLEFTVEESGLLIGTVTLNNQTISIKEGYISKNSKLKFTFTDNDGNSYLAKGLYTPANPNTNTPAQISGTFKALTDGQTNEEVEGPGEVDDPTWSATAETGNDSDH